ncbi:MAG: polysaccharide biosynthesis/export family protein [Cyanobacteria bacterium J06634_5]
MSLFATPSYSAHTYHRLAALPLCTLAALIGITGAPAIAQNPAQRSSTIKAPTLSNGYVLAYGDRLYLEVFGLPDYAGEFEVLADGSVRLPMVGQVRVQGLTLEQAQAAVTQAYGRYIRQPFVDLNLIESRPVQIAIAGEVNRPGAYAIEPDDNNNAAGPMTVTKAIQLAGGITQLANIRQVQIVRGQGVPGVVPQSANIDLWELIQSGDLSQDVALRDGDTVVVPEASSVNAAEATRIASANFSPDTITVYLVGEVESPGALQLQPNIPLNQALLAAGGFTNRAVEGAVELVRLSPDGTVSKSEVEIDFGQDVNSQRNPILQDNDTIVIRETGLSEFSDRAGQVFSPALGLFRVLDFLF